MLTTQEIDKLKEVLKMLLNKLQDIGDLLVQYEQEINNKIELLTQITEADGQLTENINSIKTIVGLVREEIEELHIVVDELFKIEKLSH